MSKRKDLWKTSDSAWFETRHAEWLLVKRNLKLMKNFVDPKAFPYFEYLFFNGVLHEDHFNEDPFFKAEFREINGLTKVGSLLVELWFYPEISQGAYNEICVSAEKIRYRIAEASNHLSIYYKYGSEYQTEYGLFGGREEMIVQALFPSLDYKELWSTSDNPRATPSKGIKPGDAIFYWSVDTTNLLGARNKNPYLMGQYFIDHLDFTFEHYFNEVLALKNSDKKLDKLKRIMFRVIDFYERDGEHKESNIAASYREKLYSRFESAGFCGRLLEMWDQQKTRFEAGESEG